MNEPMPTKKETIEAHLAQLKDMENNYPEGYKCFHLLKTHLKGLLNVKNSRPKTNSVTQNQRP